MKSLPTILCAAIVALAIAGCAVTPTQPTVIYVPMSNTDEAASQKAEAAELQRAEDAQIKDIAARAQAAWVHRLRDIRQSNMGASVYPRRIRVVGWFQGADCISWLKNDGHGSDDIEVDCLIPDSKKGHQVVVEGYRPRNGERTLVRSVYLGDAGPKRTGLSLLSIYGHQPFVGTMRVGDAGWISQSGAESVATKLGMSLYLDKDACVVPPSDAGGVWSIFVKRLKDGWHAHDFALDDGALPSTRTPGSVLAKDLDDATTALADKYYAPTGAAK